MVAAKQTNRMAISVWGAWDEILARRARNTFRGKVCYCQKCNTIMSYALYARHKSKCNGTSPEKPSTELMQKRKSAKLSMRRYRAKRRENALKEKI